MNIDPGTEGTLLHFFMAVIPFTLIIIWLIVVYQIQATTPLSHSEDEAAKDQCLERYYGLYDGWSSHPSG